MVLSQIYSNSNKYILKGGTALLLCYGITRFSEDIDLDAMHTTVGIESILNKYGWQYRIAKNTNTVKRYMIHYGGKKPLKIEISYRSRVFNESLYYKHSNGIIVYTISELARLKVEAFLHRDRIRDLYDLVFICKNYWNLLEDTTKNSIIDAFYINGFDYYDYISKIQQDEFIALGYAYLEVLTSLGLI